MILDLSQGKKGEILMMKAYATFQESYSQLKNQLNKWLKLQSTVSYAKNCQLLKDTDIILLSYPRSGNTWSRYVLADLILQAHDFSTSVQLPIDFYQVIPSIYTHKIDTVIDERIRLPYRLIKSHHHGDAIRRRFIYIFRDPINTLISYYRFLVNHPDPSGAIDLFPPKSGEIQDLTQISLDKFCLSHIDPWKEHLEKALLQYQKDPGKVCLLCYEKLRDIPICWISVVRFLGLGEEQIDIDRALENQSLENRINILKQTDQKSELAFNVGSADINSTNRTELSDSVRNVIKANTQSLYDQMSALSCTN
jgi:hypothetical protein